MFLNRLRQWLLRRMMQDYGKNFKEEHILPFLQCPNSEGVGALQCNT